MTETPPENSPPVPPTQTEKDAQATNQEVQGQAPLGYNDHRTYSMSLYNQPVWVVDAVFSTGQLDPNEQYTPGQVQGAIDQMMATPDKQYETPQEVQ